MARPRSSKIILLIIIASYFNFYAQVQISAKYNTDQESSPKYTVTKIKSKKTQMELSHTLKSLIINSSGQYRVFQQTITSVSIQGEGPHLDLIDWKHGKSKFQKLSGSKNEFLYIDQTKEAKFPKISLDELVSKAAKAGGRDWEKIAKECKSPSTYPCDVLPSAYIFRIEQMVNGEWVEKSTYRFYPPMGC